jgi:hypothetical protein
MLVAGALLIADSFLDWQRVEFGLGRLGSGSVSANAWDDFLGAMMGLLTIALVAWVVTRLAGVELPIWVSHATVCLLLSALVLGLGLAKILTNDYVTWAGYAGVALAALLVVGAVLEVRSESTAEDGGTVASDLTDGPSTGTGA